jgi:hypothetical protein
MRRLDDKGHCRGSIGGLVLPPNIWYVLRRENIKTMNKLRAVADHLERLDGIGPKRAQAIRAELARVASPDKGQSSGAP